MRDEALLNLGDARKRLDEAEAMLGASEAVDHYWQEQKEQALEDIKSLLENVEFYEWAIAEERRQEA